MQPELKIALNSSQQNLKTNYHYFNILFQCFYLCFQTYLHALGLTSGA